jgi:hypothetical protein
MDYQAFQTIMDQGQSLSVDDFEIAQALLTWEDFRAENMCASYKAQVAGIILTDYRTDSSDVTVYSPTASAFGPSTTTPAPSASAFDLSTTASAPTTSAFDLSNTASAPTASAFGPIGTALTPTVLDEEGLPHREWEDIATLDLKDIVAHINDLRKRSILARGTLDKALNDFERCTNAFLAQKKTEDVAAYLADMNKALAAGDAIFKPQKAYRNTLTTLGMLATDMIECLPKDSTLKRLMEEHLDEGLAKMTEQDQLPTLWGGLLDPKVSKNDALLAYMGVMRQRALEWMLGELRYQTLVDVCLHKFSGNLKGAAAEAGSDLNGGPSGVPNGE